MEWVIDRLRSLRPAHQLGIAAAVLAGVLAAMIAVRIALAVVTGAIRQALKTATFALRVMTFRLYRRCPDCHSLIHADARVCLRCSHRTRPAPAERGRR